jgi:hypothetical protein
VCCHPKFHREKPRVLGHPQRLDVKHCPSQAEKKAWRKCYIKSVISFFFYNVGYEPGASFSKASLPVQ